MLRIVNVWLNVFFLSVPDPRVLLTKNSAAVVSTATAGGASASASSAAGAGAGATATTVYDCSEQLFAASNLDFVVLLTDNVRIATTSLSVAAEIGGGDDLGVAVGTRVFMVSHPRGKRLYYSDGVVTSWTEGKDHFKHSIPTMPGSSGT